MTMRILAMMVLGVFVATTPALADNRKDAETFFRAGEKAYQAANYKAAAEMFEEAYALMPLPAIAFSLAQAYRLQYARDEDPRKLRRAVELYREYLDKEPRGARAADASANLADLLPAYSRLSGKGAAALESRDETKIMVSSSAPNATGSIDGGPMKPLPLVEVVSAGDHKVKVEAPGYFPVEQTYPVVTGQFRAVEAELRPQPVTVELKARDDSEIHVDGRLVGVTPMARLEVTAGPHFIAVSRRGRKAWSQNIDGKNGQAIALEAEQPMTYQRIASYAVLGTAGVFLLGSGLTALDAASLNKDAKNLEAKRLSESLTADEYTALQGKIDRRDDRLKMSGILLGVGVGAAATGALLFFLDHPEAEAPRATPVVTPGGAGLAVRGNF
jgi:hypothetical protein